MENVVGALEDNSFLKDLNASTNEFISEIKQIFCGLTK